jgi:hypothetical protein
LHAVTDQERILYAIRESRLILAQYIEPGPRDADETINQLLAILDHNDVVESVDRLEVELGLRFP